MEASLKDAEQYVGMPYWRGMFDCADLARMVQWEVFGRRIALPDRRARPGGVRGQGREIQRWQGEVAQRIDEPVTGCGVLMTEPGDGPASAPTWHIGTAFLEGGQIWVLHNSEGMGGAALQRLADLQRFGLRLEGFYAWRVLP